MNQNKGIKFSYYLNSVAAKTFGIICQYTQFNSTYCTNTEFCMKALFKGMTSPHSNIHLSHALSILG